MQSHSPKLTPRRSGWYRYYAGYSLDFVRDIISSLELAPESRILDPWNGSGTTLVAASEAKHEAVGVDANPALVLVAKGRLLGSEVVASLPAISDELVNLAKLHRQIGSPDPLGQWFDAESAARIRRLEWAIQHLLVNHDTYQPVRLMPDLERISSLTAFYYVVLFEVVRALSRPFQSSNPTWVRTSAGSTSISASWSQIESLITGAVARLSTSLLRPAGPNSRRTPGHVLLGNSTALPVDDSYADAIITSPPYCTRIDYIVATLPELAVLGYSRESLRALRDEMIGTPTIHVADPTIPDDWGIKAAELLRAVQSHESKASPTYYFKNFWQYFDGMFRSLVEMRRVLRHDGRMVLVAQDSYYKDAHVDLPAILADMARVLGWNLDSQQDFVSARNRAAINPRARRYRSLFGATESVLVLGHRMGRGRRGY